MNQNIVEKHLCCYPTNFDNTVRNDNHSKNKIIKENNLEWKKCYGRMSDQRGKKAGRRRETSPTHWLISPWILCIFSIIWERKPLKLLSSQGLKGWRGPVVPKGRSPLILLAIHALCPGKLALTLPAFTLPHPTNYTGPQDLTLLALWLLGQDTWPQATHSHATPALTTPALATLAFGSPCPTLPWTYAFQPTCLSTPLLGRMDHQETLLVLCLIDSLISLLHWREESSFWEFLP